MCQSIYQVCSMVIRYAIIVQLGVHLFMAIFCYSQLFTAHIYISKNYKCKMQMFMALFNMRLKTNLRCKRTLNCHDILRRIFTLFMNSVSWWRCRWWWERKFMQPLILKTFHHHSHVQSHFQIWKYSALQYSSVYEYASGHNIAETC